MPRTHRRARAGGDLRQWPLARGESHRAHPTPLHQSGAHGRDCFLPGCDWDGRTPSLRRQSRRNGITASFRGATPWIVDRSLLGYIMYECIRALDYLNTRDDVDPKRIMCTGASGGGKQSMFFAALDDRLAGAVPVCYISSYQAHIGATACVGEFPSTSSLREPMGDSGVACTGVPYCASALPATCRFFCRRRCMRPWSARNKSIACMARRRRCGGVEVDSKHDHNREMREILYRHVAEQLLGKKQATITEPEDLPVEKEATCASVFLNPAKRCSRSHFVGPRKMVVGYRVPANASAWKKAARKHSVAKVKNENLRRLSQRHWNRKRTLVSMLT